MLKYKNTYRVCYEFDKRGKPAEFTFIPCRIKRGANIYRFNADTLLVYIPSVTIGKKLLKTYKDIFSLFLEGDFEIVLKFSEKELVNIKKILKIVVKGKNLSPKNKANIKYSEICGGSIKI